MENHLAEMQNLIDQLASLGEPLAEHLSVALFLSSLPDSYGTLITALETRPEEDLTTEIVKGKLLEEFKRRSNVFPMQNELESKVPKMTETEVKPRPPLTCFFCKKPNHVKKIHRVEKEEPRSHGQNTEGKCDGERTGRKSYILFLSYDIWYGH